MGEHDEDEVDRTSILARRKRFIAAALVGVASAVGVGAGEGCGPSVCLSPAIDSGPRDGGPEGGPVDGGEDGGGSMDGGGSDGAAPTDSGASMG